MAEPRGDLGRRSPGRAVLILGAKARAALHGSYLVREEDVEAVAAPVLNHRILTNFAAQSEGLSTRKIVERLYEEVADEMDQR